MNDEAVRHHAAWQKKWLGRIKDAGLDGLRVTRGYKGQGTIPVVDATSLTQRGLIMRNRHNRVVLTSLGEKRFADLDD